jgi:predicted  nucleic acid-binding Zn-ribbon protein
MKTSFNRLLWAILLFFGSLTAFAQGECVVVIQGARDKPDEDFFKKSTDAFVKGMGYFPGGANITVLRPPGETSDLGQNPPRTEQNYANKADLLKKLKAAICNTECKNVVIAFVAHGIGGTDLDTPPKDSLSGGISISKGTSEDDILFAREVAAIIDSCGKAVKLVAASCYSEAMVRGIEDEIRNKGLIGVGVSSSEWKEKSWATGGYYDFIKHFLEDYYAIIGDPNIMAQLAKNAEELKKKNKEYNDKIKKENAAQAAEIDALKKELAKLTTAFNKLDADLKKARSEADSTQKAINLLNERKKLEEDYAKATGDAKKQLKAALDANAKALKNLKVTVPTDPNLKKRLEKIDKEIEKQEKSLAKQKEDIEDLEAKHKAEFERIKPRRLEIENRLMELDYPPKVLLPEDRVPLMELVIHEAFKSAKIKTKAGNLPNSNPQEPVPPKIAGAVEVPSTPFIRMKVGDYYVRFYKVIDKATNKCVIVGYQCNAAGIPLQPLKSYSCEIKCDSAKFSFMDGENEKIVTAKKKPDNSYEVKINAQPVSGVQYQYQKSALILPGQLTAEAYYIVDFTGIPKVTVPNGKVTNINFDRTNNVLTFDLEKDGRKYKIRIAFLPHGEQNVSIENLLAYKESHSRQYVLLDNANQPAGSLTILANQDDLLMLTGTVKFYNNNNNQPIGVNGHVTPDGTRFQLTSSDFSQPLIIQPSLTHPSLMVWQTPSGQGALQPDLQNEPAIVNATLEWNNNGNMMGWLLKWQVDDSFLSLPEISAWKGIRILKRLPFTTQTQVIDLPQHAQIYFDPSSNVSAPATYQILPIVAPSSTCQCYSNPLFDQGGEPVLLSSGAAARQGVEIEEYQLFQNAPNPFDQSTSIGFVLPENEHVILYFHNQWGQIVKRLSGWYEKGKHNVTIYHHDLGASGLYFYQLQTQKGIITKKMLLVK